MLMLKVLYLRLCKSLGGTTVSDDCKHTANVSVDFSEERAIPQREENVVNHYRSYLSLLITVKYNFPLYYLHLDEKLF